MDVHEKDQKKYFFERRTPFEKFWTRAFFRQYDTFFSSLVSACSSIGCALATFSYFFRVETISPQDFLREVRRSVISFMRDNPESKIQISLICEMMRTDLATGNIVSVERAAFNSKQEAVYDATDLEDLYERMVSKILESFSAYLRKGSGWTLKGVVRWDITRAKNKPLKGSSHMDVSTRSLARKTPLQRRYRHQKIIRKRESDEFGVQRDLKLNFFPFLS